MCTITWWNQPDSYEVFFNRDELRNRSCGLSPRQYQYAGVNYLCPLDPDGGGTWLLVNHYAVTIGVINKYTEFYKVGGLRVSRGLLVKSLADCKTPRAIEKRLRALELSHYAPFMLYSIALNSDAYTYYWNGKDLVCNSYKYCINALTSSSYKNEEVSSYREKVYSKILADSQQLNADNLWSYHSAHNPELPAHSVFMSREDGQTVSLSRILVKNEKAYFSYYDVTPHDTALDTVISCELEVVPQSIRMR